MWLTERLPTWLAPNLVTVAGFAPLVASYLLLWRYSPDFATTVPRWLCFFVAFSTFFYQSTDAMDGKQARRTGSATPLGQLFDHGFDCLACISVHSAAGMVLLFGGSFLNVGCLAALMTGFFLAQWQERWTGVMPTSSSGVVGVTEVQWFLIIAVIVTGFAAPGRPFGVLVSQRLAQGWMLFCTGLVVVCLKQTLGHVQRTSPHLMAQAIRDTLPVLAIDGLLVLLPRHALAHSPRVVPLLAGLLFYFYTVQMILFSMAKEPFPTFQPTILIFAALVGLAHALPGNQAAVGLAFSGATCLVAARVALWLLVVIYELKGKLGINVWTISTTATATAAA
jgi:phosphatidylglycerophosphate synthase